MRADYDERVARLRAAAAERTITAAAQAQRAINALMTRGEAINFNTVAREAQVSKDFLYAQPEIASRIKELRRQGTPSIQRPNAERPTESSLANQLAVLRRSNEELRAENAELREANTALRGEVVRLRRR